MTMYDAILESANVPAVSLLNELGVEEGKQYLEKRKCSYCRCWFKYSAWRIEKWRFNI